MASVASTGVSLSSTFYLRNFYKADTKAFKASVRNDYSNNELAYEDGLALRRAARKLASYEYSEEENQENICSGILAYVDTYNNALTSSGKSEDADVSRYSKQLKRLSSKYSEGLEEIGITVNKDGTLTANKTLLSKADTSQLKEVFSKDSDFVKFVKTIGKKMSSNSRDAIYSEMTKTGMNLNITL